MVSVLIFFVFSIELSALDNNVLKMYPYQSHNQVCLVHASPEVERDSAIVIFDINLLSHMWDKAVECVYCETNDHHNEKAKANGPDLSMLTMNLYCTYNNNNKKNDNN